MSTKIKSIAFLVSSTVLMFAQGKLPFEVEKGWEVTGLEAPESVVFDEKNNVLYVSNVNGNPGDKDGNGYISKVGIDGKIIEQKWVEGLNGPKGLSIHKGKLYVADIDNIVEIDIKSKEKKSYIVEGATFLNDIVVDSKGNVYASNTFGYSGIFKLSNGKVEMWIKDEALNGPNGLIIEGNDIIVSSWGSSNPNPADFSTEVGGKLIKISLKDKKMMDITKPVGNLDGLEASLHGYLMTDWFAGKLLYYNNKTKETTDVVTLAKGSADLTFVKKSKTIYIPIMLEGKLLKYSFKK